MKYSNWLKLTDDERDEICQQLSPYDDWDLFKAVESEFVSKFGTQQGVGQVFCGLRAGLGSYNAIIVEILPKAKRTKLPKRFLGFPIVKEYHRK